MPAFGRPRVAALVPVLAVVSAAALLLLVALSIAVQPPATAGMDGVARILAWARAVLFSAGAVAFLIGIVAFARMPAGGTEEAEPEDVLPAAPGPRPSLQLAGVPGADVERRAARVRAMRARKAESEVRFTLVALGAADDDVRAIADFDDASLLLDTLRIWRRQHQEEELRVFTRDGALLARCAPSVAEAPAESLPSYSSERYRRPRARRRHARVAVGGAS